MQYGDRLWDDLMNTFCERLQAACPRRIDGCLAIQFPLICLKSRELEPESLEWLVSIDRPAHQIIFDPDRVHYVVVVYDPKAKIVFLYDSLLTKPICEQILALFAHAFNNNEVNLAIPRSYDRQTDSWSCGYRSIACMVDLARNRNPCDTRYCTKSIFAFFRKVIAEDQTEWQAFESVYFGDARENHENAVTIVRLYPDLTFEEPLD